MRIAVCGLGYVGSTLAAVLSQSHEVVGVDIEQSRVSDIRAGCSPMRDSALSDFMATRNLSLQATTDAGSALEGSEFVIVATPTPFTGSLGQFDTSSVESVIEQVCEYEPLATIVIRSTVPIGFADSMIARFNHPSILCAPEFLREKSALYDCLNPTRIVVGSGDLTAAERFAQVLQGCLDAPQVPVVLTGTREAEAIKLFANAYLALRVAFFNELDTLALARGLETAAIVRGVGVDPRIGLHYNNPSFGYGGHCLPKDARQLETEFTGIPHRLVGAIDEANEVRLEFIFEEVRARCSSVAGAIGVMITSSFESDGDAQMVRIAKLLSSSGVRLVVYCSNLHCDMAKSCPRHGQRDFEVTHDLQWFKSICEIIVADRLTPDIADVTDKVYTRDMRAAP